MGVHEIIDRKAVAKTMRTYGFTMLAFQDSPDDTRGTAESLEINLADFSTP